MAKIYTFHAPKTSGASVIALNTALVYQHQNLDQKVLLLELSGSSDLLSYTNIEHDRFWNDLSSFYKTPEWSPSLVHEIKINEGVDIIFSREGDESLDFEPIWDLIVGEYDIVFVDLSRGFNTPYEKICLERTDHLCLFSCLDPICLNSLENFWEKNKLHQDKAYLCINQCPKGAIASAQRKINKLGIELIHIFPFDEKVMWKQVFEGQPVITQKKSKLSKSISKFVSELSQL